MGSESWYSELFCHFKWPSYKKKRVTQKKDTERQTFFHCEVCWCWGLGWGWMIGLRANRCAINVLHVKLPCHAYNQTALCCTAQVCTEEPEREGGGLKVFE